MQHSKYLPKLIALFIFLKLFYLVFAVGLSKLNIIDQNYSFSANSYIELSMRKDAFWYKKISVDGYTKGKIQDNGSRHLEFASQQSEWAFFPFYPLINSALSNSLSISYEYSALISSILFSLLALIGCFLLYHYYFDDEHKAFWGTLLTFIFPFHFYFSMFLTEAPFFAALTWVFYLIARNKSQWASIILIPLVLLRPNGLVLLLPIFMFYLERHNALNFKNPFGKTTLRGLSMFIPAVFPLILFLCYQYQMTGHFFAFSAAQKGWGKELLFPLCSLFRLGGINYQFTSYYTVAAMVFFLFKYKVLPRSFNFLILFTLLLPLTSGSTYSIIRYLSIAFPIFLILSDTLYQSKLRALIIAAILCLHMGSFYLWIIDHPLGY